MTLVAGQAGQYVTRESGPAGSPREAARLG